MDPATAGLVASVMSVLMPYAAKGAEEFVRGVGRDAYEKAKGLFSTLRARWAGDKEATDALVHFEEKPERYQPVLEAILTEKLAQDQELAKELADQLNRMRPDLEVIQRMEEGRRVTGLEAEEMRQGTAHIEQDIKRGEDVTGGRFDRIG
jgi:hypothetical protein